MTPLLGTNTLMTYDRQLLMPPPTTLLTNSGGSVNPLPSMSLMSPLIPAPSPLNQEPPLHQPNPLPMPLGSSPFTPNGAAAAEALRASDFEVSVPAAAVIGDGNSASLASGAAVAGSEATRREESTAHCRRTCSRHSSPVIHLLLTTSDTVPNVTDPENIATATTPLRCQQSLSQHCQHLYLSPLQLF
jgi:hypothetical protein